MDTGVKVGIDVNSVVKANMLATGLATAGAVTGVVVAVVRKSGFWGGMGWFLLGSIAGGALGAVINSTRKSYTTATTSNTTA